MRGEEMELNVLRASGVLEDGENSSHCAAEVIGVEGHGDVDGVVFARVSIAECRSFAEDGDIRGSGFAYADGGDGVGVGGGGEEEERQEAEKCGGGGGHPVLSWKMGCGGD